MWECMYFNFADFLSPMRFSHSIHARSAFWCIIRVVCKENLPEMWVSKYFRLLFFDLPEIVDMFLGFLCSMILYHPIDFHMQFRFLLLALLEKSMKFQSTLKIQINSIAWQTYECNSSAIARRKDSANSHRTRILLILIDSSYTASNEWRHSGKESFSLIWEGRKWMDVECIQLVVVFIEHSNENGRWIY